MTIGLLEAQLDLKLFDRSKREAKPTAHALSLEPMVRQFVDQLHQIEIHSLSLHQGLEKCLTLAVSPEILGASWSPPLKILGQEFPGLEVKVMAAAQDDARRLLYDGTAQIVLAHENSHVDKRVSIQVVGRETFVCVISPEHECMLKRRRLQAEDIFDIRQIAVASRDTGSIDPRFLVSQRIWRTDSYYSALALVRSGAGWSYLPSDLVRRDIKNGELLEVSFDNFTNQVWLWINVVWLKNTSLGLGARRYIDLMRQNAAIPIKNSHSNRKEKPH